MADNGMSWTVTRQREREAWVDGQYLPGMQVYFRTAAGNEGSVFVLDTDYSADRIRALVAARAAAMDNTLHLTGS